MRDDEYKPVSWILSSLIDSAAKGGSFQVAYGPPPSGKWQPEVVERLKLTGAWLKVNGEAIYCTRERNGPYKEEAQIKRNGTWEPVEVFFTRSKDSKMLYALYVGEPGEALRLKTVQPASGSAITLFGSKETVEWQERDGYAELSLPADMGTIQPGMAYAFRIAVGK